MIESTQGTSEKAASNVLDDAIARVRASDPSLAQTLTREVEALRDGRKFGLVFEAHLPESVRLPDHPIKRGVKVAPRTPAKGQEGLVWRVARVAGASGSRTALLDDGSTVPVDALVVIRDFGEAVYPGLNAVGTMADGPVDAPWHTVINGENFHVLQALRYTHRKSVDLIYIDPPYNTGNESWIYNDRYVADQDAFKHSKWLSFMERRLKIARDLLKDTGIIIVAIGDDEHHRLRMLMDQVFGSSSFIVNVVWQGGGSSLSRFHAGGIDHMLVYARDMPALVREDVRWKVEKEGLQDVLDAASAAWVKSEHDSVAASRLLAAWWNKNKARYDPGLGDNVKIDGTGTVVKVGDLGNSLYRPNLRYPITDPATGTTYDPPENGWRFKREVMDELIQRGGVLFGTRPRLKTPLSDMSMRSVLPSFYKDRRASSQHLAKILGDKKFPFPKDVDILARWINITTSRNPNAVILDFFGGSGTCTEAVLQLNAKDGGTRQSILVTNNEVAAIDAKVLSKNGHRPGDDKWEASGVFRDVTRPRITTVVTGIRPDGSTFSDGLAANVKFFDLTYLDPDQVNRAREFKAIAPLLWLKAGGTGDQITTEPSVGYAIAERYAVLSDIDEAEPFFRALFGADVQPALIFVVTDSDSDFEAISSQLPSGSRPVKLYESYLRNFEINVEGL